MPPVTAGRTILDNCILGIDARGEEYVAAMGTHPGRERLYALNGNVLGTAYSLPKLAWVRDHERELFQRAHRFLLWSGLVGFLLGGEPVTDYSLASRTLLFDLHAEDWSPELLEATGIPLKKLRRIVPAGTVG